MPTRSAYNARKRSNFTKAGIVTTYRVCPCGPDPECDTCHGAGRVAIDAKAAYEPARADRIIENGKRAPQTYNEAPGTSHKKLAGRANSIQRGRRGT